MMASASVRVFGLVEEVFGTHDAGVVDDDVEGGVVGGELRGDAADVGGVFDVEDRWRTCRGWRRWSRRGLLAAAGDDDFVAELVEGLCEAAADTGAAAGDEDGVAGDFHRGSPEVIVGSMSLPVQDHRDDPVLGNLRGE